MGSNNEPTHNVRTSFISGGYASNALNHQIGRAHLSSVSYPTINGRCDYDTSVRTSSLAHNLRREEELIAYEANKKLEQLRRNYGVAIRDVRSLCHSPGERIYLEDRNFKDVESRILRNNTLYATDTGGKKMIANEYFQYNERCVKHDRYQCEDCKKQLLEKQRSALIKIETTEIATNNDLALSRKMERIDSFESSVSFVKEALNYDDKKMAKVKIKDIPKLIAQAQDEMTVGKMEKFVSKEKRKIGVIGRSILRLFFK